MPFKGELMQCAICEKTRRSNRYYASRWVYIRLNDIGFYACPQCMRNTKKTEKISSLTLNKVRQALGASLH